MDSETLGIVLIVVLTVFILVLRYGLNVLFHKGSDAIENGIRKKYNEYHPPESQSLANRYHASVSTEPQNLSNRFQTKTSEESSLKKVKMFCPHCGASLKVGAPFCGKCGHKVND